MIQNIRTCRPAPTQQTHTTQLLHTNNHEEKFHTHDNDATQAEWPKEATRRKRRHHAKQEWRHPTPTGCGNCHQQQPVTDIQHWHR